ncbi:arabinan endo-1,5-alpha-L-arabinosidase [Rugosimonospora acidiphila]|uniref:Arabinan endo-1,5-alpha-L-arabinosidase n=1 Tax=Rugosimonospora acidiphila TaxID=556531 RepID=A0ABP9SUM2_9ACTN
MRFATSSFVRCLIAVPVAAALVGLGMILPGGGRVAHGGAPAASQATPPHGILGDAHTHDPSLARTRTGWYVFSTGDPQVAGGAIQIRYSRDGRTWSSAGTVGTAIPSWVGQAVPGVSNLWAPDVSYHDGQWYLYYAASTFGSNRSVIGLFTNPTLDPRDPRYGWVDQGLVTESNVTDDYNAIDPSLFVDHTGAAWLTLGSYWSGVKLIPVELPSGKPATAQPPRVSLVDRHFGPNAVEAPYLVEHGGWYYLLVSFDSCCQGANSTYREVMGRSRTVGGPYLDRAGVSMLAGGGSALLDGEGGMRGPGGASVSGDVLAFHYYDAARQGDFHLGLARLDYRDGWPTIVELRI